MKKLLLLSTALILLSCDKEDSGCNCDGLFSTLNGYPNTFTIPNVKIDCETRNLAPGQNIQSNAIFLRCK